MNIREYGAFILIPYCITIGALDFDILGPCPQTRLEDIRSNRNWDAAVWRRSIARYDPSFDREVAVKVLPREMVHNLVFRVRFKRELKMIASLEHPAIVPVYDVGEESDGRQYFVMRYMGGESLSDWIKRGALSLQDTAILIERLASALDYAHQKGIVHRDIKPDNVLFDDTNHPYLTDFGIAKLTESAISATGGGTMGTPAYVSPEQAQGANVDSRADIYGMGVMIYEMLTGRKPYDAESPMSVAVRHITEPIPDILQANPDLPIEVDTIIRTAMAKDREDRYPNAIELSRALNRAAFGDDRTNPASPSMFNTRQNTLTQSRRRVGFIVAGMILLVVLAGAFALSRQLPIVSAVDMTRTAAATPVACNCHANVHSPINGYSYSHNSRGHRSHRNTYRASINSCTAVWQRG